MLQTLAVNKLIEMQGYCKLWNGVELPSNILGTFRLQGEACYAVVKYALQNHLYEHIDTASCYYNEETIGEAIKDSRVAREDIFITTKVSPKDMGFESCLQAVEQSLKKLQVDFVDLLLIHWPAKSRIPITSDKHPQYRIETWRALERLYEEKKTRAIGISNFSVFHIESLVPHCQVMPMVNQVEYHPKLIQKELYNYCENLKIKIVSYASLANGNLINHPCVCSIASFINKTPAQVLLRWGIQQNVCASAKTSTIPRLIENANIFDFQLSKEEMEKLNELHDGTHFCWDPSKIDK